MFSVGRQQYQDSSDISHTKTVVYTSGFGDSITNSIAALKKDIQNIKDFFQKIQIMIQNLRSFFSALDQTLGLFVLFYLVLVIFIGRLISFLGVPPGKGLFLSSILLADVFLYWLHSIFSFNHAFAWQLFRANILLILPFVVVILARKIFPYVQKGWLAFLSSLSPKEGNKKGVANNPEWTPVDLREKWVILQQDMADLHINMEEILWQKRNDSVVILPESLQQQIHALQTNLDPLLQAKKVTDLEPENEKNHRHEPNI